MTPVRTTLVLVGLLLLLLGAVALRLMTGPTMGWPTQAMVLGLRWERVVLAVIVGSSLAVSGVALQALLRNPLAEPFVLGLSTGAGVGVMAQLWLSYALQVSLGAPMMGALCGAGLATGVVMLAGRRGGMVDPLKLLLVGVVLGTINGAVIMLLNYLAGPGGVRTELAAWMMGYLDESSSSGVRGGVGAVTLAGTVTLSCLGRSMDASSFSDSEALSLGVDLRRLRWVLVVVAGVLAAGAVVLSGPLAFVGLIAPHLARLALGPGHRALVIGSALTGAALIVLSDCASVVLGEWLHVGRLPLGIFTAALGGVVFLLMLGRDEAGA